MPYIRATYTTYISASLHCSSSSSGSRTLIFHAYSLFLTHTNIQKTYHQHNLDIFAVSYKSYVDLYMRALADNISARYVLRASNLTRIQCRSAQAHCVLARQRELLLLLTTTTRRNMKFGTTVDGPELNSQGLSARIIIIIMYVNRRSNYMKRGREREKLKISNSKGKIEVDAEIERKRNDSRLIESSATASFLHGASVARARASEHCIAAIQQILPMLRYIGSERRIRLPGATSDFCTKINKIFDCLNARSSTDSNPYRRGLSSKSTTVEDELKNSSKEDITMAQQRHRRFFIKASSAINADEGRVREKLPVIHTFAVLYTRARAHSSSSIDGIAAAATASEDYE
ncbi:unnamed protein product [Trichogramma brassicae]|uniref:Uncharacterized protein n=1 Tax=Trichogramma brassicae TaxID=86971 RepID=A0A6H5I9W6_9HYME|nr:unnamed protein product [Trichogramma brassicae]